MGEFICKVPSKIGVKAIILVKSAGERDEAASAQPSDQEWAVRPSVT
jgi:hypothetical protein